MTLIKEQEQIDVTNKKLEKGVEDMVNRAVGFLLNMKEYNVK